MTTQPRKRPGPKPRRGIGCAKVGVTLRRDQIHDLDAIMATTDLPRSVLVQRAVDAFLATRREATRREATRDG